MNDRTKPLAPLSPESIAPLGEPEKLIDPQPDGLDVEFFGWKIGEGEITTGNRGTTVTVWLTTKGRLLTQRRSWTREPATQTEPDWDTEAYSSLFHITPARALEWLIKDGKGRLGRASKAAWVQACRTFGPMSGMDLEREE